MRKPKRNRTQRRYRVFLSHASLDDLIAQTVRDKIQTLGIDVWLDDLDMHAGQEAEAAIMEGIRKSDELLVLVSAASLRSHWVNTEIGMAMITGKWISPILVSLRPDELPNTIRGRNPQMLNELERYLKHLKSRAKRIRSAGKGRRR